MMASFALRLVTLVTLVTVSLVAPAMAAGPVFETPEDGMTVQGKVLIKADKRQLDGNQAGYVSYRITGQDADAPAADQAVALVYPFEYTWDTQKAYINTKDPFDPHNGSRQFPDGVYTVTATAFSANGRATGDASRVTVTVANGIADVPRNVTGRVLLQPGGRREETIRYKAEGELLARLTGQELDDLEAAGRPALVEMKMEAAWRNVVRKPYGPGHTQDGKRWHGQRDAVYTRVPGRKGAIPSWRNLRYGVIDQYPESGYVEMLGRSLPQMGEAWERRGVYYLGDPTTNVLNISGAAGGAAVGGMAGMGGMPGGMGMEAGMAGGAGMPGGGMPGGGAMAGGAGMPGGEPGMAGGGMMGGEMGGMVGGMTAGTAATIRPLDRLASFAPVNLNGLGTKFRSVVNPNGSIQKMQIGDPRWPLGELWIPLPNQPVKEGDTWHGAMTIMPFFDQQYHIRVHPGGGSASGPHHLTPLYHYQRQLITPRGGGPQMVEVTPGGRNGMITHILDGFEQFRGYECARIVTRFRNHANPDAWSVDYMSGWLLSDLNPRMVASGTSSASAMVQTDLTRVTYYAYRSGHVVGMEDYYHHKLWLNEQGFNSLFTRSGRHPGVREVVAQPAGVPPFDGGRRPWPVDPRYGVTLGAAGAAGACAPGMGMMGMGEMGGMGMGVPGGGGMAGPPGGAMPGMPGMGGPGMGEMGGGMPGVGGEEGPQADDVFMADVVANAALKIYEVGGSDAENPRPKPQYAQLPPTNVPTEAPGVRKTESQAIRAYVVVEDEAMFYLPGSQKLEGKRGIQLSTSAKQLMELGFKPDADIQL